MKKNRQLTVTILSKFLDFGKTTLLNHIFYNKEGLKVAVMAYNMIELE